MRCGRTGRAAVLKKKKKGQKKAADLVKPEKWNC